MKHASDPRCNQFLNRQIGVYVRSGRRLAARQGFNANSSNPISKATLKVLEGALSAIQKVSCHAMSPVYHIHNLPCMAT
jgi:hypothetical protein